MTSTVWFASGSLTALTSLAAQSADGLETGGILLGYDEGLMGDYFVRHCGEPGAKARRTPTFFSRDLAHARRLAHQAFASDRSVWIGEWHTHLIALAEPSERDLLTYTGLLQDPDLGFGRILSVIVLPEVVGDWSCLVLYAWSFTGSILRRLPIGLPEGTTPSVRVGSAAPSERGRPRE